MDNEENEIEEWAPFIIVLITLVGGSLRVLLLASKGLWFDETFSIWLANHDVANMLQWIARVDQHPPLYYLLLHYWIALTGDNPYDARLLSALFGAATIPMIYLIGKRLSGAVVGLAAALFLALSPFNIRLSQDTRMYTLLAFNASVAIYALVVLLTDSRSVKPIGSQFRENLRAWLTSRPVQPASEGDLNHKDARNQNGWRARIFGHRGLPIETIETDLAWVVFIVFSAATLFSHNTAVLFLLATNIFVLGLMLYQRIRKSESVPTFRAPSFWNWVIAQVGIIILWSPWIYTFIQQASQVYQEFWIPQPSWDSVIQALTSFLNEYTLVKINQVIIIWILYALVLGLGMVYYRKNLTRFLFLAALFAIPFLGELIVSLRRPIFLDRTLIWITIPLFLLLAAGVAQLKFRVLVILAVGILGANNLFSAADYFRFYQTAEDWKNPAGFVARFAQKDDLILFNSTWVQIPFDYYFIPFEEQYSLQVDRRGVPVEMSESRLLEPKMTDSDIPEFVSSLSGRNRVWLVYSQKWNTDPTGIIPRTLASEMKLVQQREYYGVLVQLYETP